MLIFSWLDGFHFSTNTGDHKKEKKQISIEQNERTTKSSHSTFIKTEGGIKVEWNYQFTI